MIEIFNKPNRPREIKPLEIAQVTKLSPFAIEINNVEYTSDDFEMFVPKKYLIEQKDVISAPHEDQKAYVDHYDLELEPCPQRRPMKFRVGDLVLISDMGNQIVVITQLYPLHKGEGIE